MAEVCYYTDEQVSRAVVRGLRNRGIDVLTAQEAALLGAPDNEHLVFARREGRVLFTQDVDFLRMAATGVDHAGIVYAHQRTPVGHIIRGLSLIHQILEAEEMIKQVEYL